MPGRRRATQAEQRTPGPAPAQPRNAISIYVRESGEVVFGDLPPELAEVAAIVAGHRPETAPYLAKPADSVVS